MKTSVNKILTVAVILLLLVNIATIIFIAKGKRPEGPRRSRGNPFEMMDKELNLSEQQRAEVKKLRDAHFETMRPLSDSIRAAKSSFFNLVKEPDVSDSTLNAYSRRISDIQSYIDKLTFAHLQRVRKLFNAEQQKKYDEFVQKMIQRSGRRKDSTANKK